MFTRRRTGKQGTDRGTYTGGSLVFNGSSQYLTRTFGTSTDINACTVSFWMKGDPQDGASHFIFGAYQGSLEYSHINFVNGFFILDTRDGSTTARNRDTEDAGLLRDPHKWYHVVMQFDMDAGAANIWTVYVDNVLYADAVRNSTLTQIHLNDSSIYHIIGARNTGSVSTHYSGYLADFHWIDGDHTVAPTEFAEVSADTGAWVPKAYTGSYGNNGYRLTFDSADGDTTTVTDKSGNGNDWTENGYSSDVGSSYTNDTPVDNYATFNPLHLIDNSQPSTASTFSNGNLTRVDTGASSGCPATIFAPSDDSNIYYAEATITTLGNVYVGILSAFKDYNDNAYTDGNSVMINKSGNIFTNGDSGDNGLGGSFTTSDVIMVAFQPSTTTVWWGKNGTWYDVSSGTSTAAVSFAAAVGYDWSGDFTNAPISFYVAQSSTGTTSVTWEFGQKGFTYQPTGTKALSTANLPEPTIKLPQQYADIGLHTGNGVNPRSIDFGLSFTPDFSWTKSRDESWNHTLYDVIRGVENELVTNSTSAETNQPARGYLTAFNDGGITVASGTTSADQVNDSGQDYWSLLLKAGGSGVANTDGSISSTVSYGNGFSIITYTGTGSAATVGHGGTLGRAPDFIICKIKGSAGSWNIYHSANTSAPETDYLQFDTGATADLDSVWNDTAPTSSVFSIGAANSGSGVDYVTYCFWFDKGEGDTPYVGGSFTSTSSSDGVFIPTDKLQMFLYKRTDGAGSWTIHDTVRDTYNPVASRIFPNLSNAEVTTPDYFDILSNGVKDRIGLGAGLTFVWFGIKKIDTAYS